MKSFTIEYQLNFYWKELCLNLSAYSVVSTGILPHSRLTQAMNGRPPSLTSPWEIPVALTEFSGIFVASQSPFTFFFFFKQNTGKAYPTGLMAIPHNSYHIEDHSNWAKSKWDKLTSASPQAKFSIPAHGIKGRGELCLVALCFHSAGLHLVPYCPISCLFVSFKIFEQKVHLLRLTIKLTQGSAWG